MMGSEPEDRMSETAEPILTAIQTAKTNGRSLIDRLSSRSPPITMRA